MLLFLVFEIWLIVYSTFILNCSGTWMNLGFFYVKVIKGLLNTCHNYWTERFQIPVKPFLFENIELLGNPVVTLLIGRRFAGWRSIRAKLIGYIFFISSKCKVMKGLPNTCHNYRTEGFQIPVKPFLFENLELFGNPVVTLDGVCPLNTLFHGGLCLSHPEPSL